MTLLDPRTPSSSRQNLRLALDKVYSNFYALVPTGGITARRLDDILGDLRTQADDGSQQFKVSANPGSVNYWQAQGGAPGVGASLSVQGSETDANGSITAKGTGYLAFGNGAGTLLDVKLSGAGPVTNYWSIEAIGGTGMARLLAKSGVNTNVSMYISAQGAGGMTFANSSGNLFAMDSNSSATARSNYLYARNGATGNPAVLGATGDANTDILFQPAGSGVVRFGTHTGNADAAISGYISIKDSGGNARKLAVIT